VDKAEFNYDTESFEEKEYKLPYIINNGKKEYVLLTPKNILRKEEQTINRKDFIDYNQRVRRTIENEALRTTVDNCIQMKIRQYDEECRKNNKKINAKDIRKLEIEAMFEMANQHPEIYDYYIKIKENEKQIIEEICLGETEEQITKFLEIPNTIENFYIANMSSDTFDTAREEAIERIRYFKQWIENEDGYKALYNASNVKNVIEADIQKIFKLTWYKTNYKVDAETNNGRGPADYVVSKGKDNCCVVEFKLASNKKLSEVFAQLEVYKNANNTKDGLIVIFYFDENEYARANKVLNDKNMQKEVDKTIFLLDCTLKKSASNVKE
jgi:hypothetical protein